MRTLALVRPLLLRSLLGTIHRIHIPLHTGSRSALALRTNQRDPMASMSASADGSGGAGAAGGKVTSGKSMVVDPFAFKLFTGEKAIFTTTIDAFENELNRIFDSGEAPLVDGYAPFCKHVFVPNFAGATSTTLAITVDNEHLLRSGYEARTEKELAVLTRWFPKEALTSMTLPPATYLDVILYSREQIDKENEAMGESSGSDAPWGVVSVKPQDVAYELPMQPITMMRNALGREYGGSGVPLLAEEYQRSVDFWTNHAPIK